MRRPTATVAAWLVLGAFAALSAACSGAPKRVRAHAPNEHVYPEDGSCMSLDDARAQIAGLAAPNEKAAREAAASQGYSLVDLKGSAEVSTGILQPLWTVKDGQGTTGKTLFGPMAADGCGEAPVSDALFVAGKQGEIYAVTLDSSAFVTNVYEVCGCESELPIPRCGGAPPPQRQWVYEMPKGTRFAGTVKLTAARTLGRWEAAGREDPPCRPIPPMP